MTDFAQYLSEGKKGHLIGIGGVSMSPLAEVLCGMGLKIHGSDMNESEKIAHLRSLGIGISLGHAAENLAPDTDFVVRTAAARDDNPEIIAAAEKGIPVFERTQAWGTIMRDYKNALCISGTHGKTTTTSMATHILMAARCDPTVMIGGTLPLLKASHRIGAGDTIIMESCEYFNSFHSFFPTIAVILNIEADHLDFFKDLDDVKKSFRSFAELVPEDGCIIVNADDENSTDAVKGLDREIITFGMSASADVRGANLVQHSAQTELDIMYKGRLYTRLTLCVPGMHNVMNALAAAASAIRLGISGEAIAAGLLDFMGAGRRFEFKGKLGGADIYDDYAHHPGELKALIDAVETLDYKRNIVVFQPHTYTRTKALFNDFIQQLSRPTICYLAEIYAAREQNTTGISSADLAKQIPNSRFFASFEELEASVRGEARQGDIILTVGAGDIFRIGEHLAQEN